MYSKWMLLLYSCYKSMIHTVHTIIYRCMLQLLLIGDASQEYYRAIMHHRHNKAWYLLWISSISYRSMMCNVHIIDQLWMLHMPSIDACYTCHHLCRNFNECLFLCYDFYVLVYFGSLGYVTYIIDQIFDK